MIALSFSRMSDYRQCPYKYKLKYIEKRPEFKPDKKNVYLVRGDNIHKMLEKYVVMRRSGKTDIPPSSIQEVERTRPLIDNLMTLFDIYPEHKIAINDRFEQVDWFASDAWFRVIIDMLGFGKDLLLGDYKTGKIYDYMHSDGNLGQLHLTALVGMSLWPEFYRTQAMYIYVDHKQVVKAEVNRDDLEGMRESLQAEHAAINDDNTFVAIKNQYCKWCDATRELCEYKPTDDVPWR